MSILTPFFSWFQTQSIILNRYCAGLPSKMQNKVSVAGMFWTKPSYLFKNTKYFVFLFIKWKIRTSRCPETRWWETKKPCGQSQRCLIKTKIWTVFDFSSEWHRRDFCILMNLKYWQTIFGIIWLKHDTFSFIMSTGVKTFCHLLFRFESRQRMHISVYSSL